MVVAVLRHVFGAALYHSPRWQADMLLEQMVPTENMNTAMSLEGTGTLSSPSFPLIPFLTPRPPRSYCFPLSYFFPHLFCLRQYATVSKKKEKNLTLYCSKYANRKSHVSYALFGVCLFQCPAAKPLTSAR